jgi:hypothetical protein
LIETISNALKRYKKSLSKIFAILLILSIILTVYTFMQTATTTILVNDNNSLIETGYNYQAEIRPNVLYPDGGTVDAGSTIFKKITTAIPFNIKSIIHSEKDIKAKGTHEVQLLIKAGDLWEREFPLEEKQAFEQKGTEIPVIDQNFKIDLEEVNTFITRVQDETGVNPGQYTLEILPNIEGTINGSGVEKTFQMQDRLIFQYSYEEILLASEKNFSTMVPFTSSGVTEKNFKVFGFVIPLNFVRIGSAAFSIFLLVMLIYLHKNSKVNPITTEASELERINKRYANRIIPVSQKILTTQKSVVALDSFKSMVKISDEKEFPIFLEKEKSIFYIVDGDYLYTYEARKTNNMPEIEKKAGSDKVYARG